ncbi:hypothetical protein EW026_g8373 [Hermanssonia centrifuga]|uniref:Uncharacterized protein n=1 Tax=Hermanssonia centrifuga TaxID=98765 RepID=A0A4S4K624_9APHY|nr:hypothetical protein EW026_g8373 [Hermanssonia centrifuga]
MEAIRVGVRTPLSALLLRDGTVYFAAFLAMNIAQVLVATMPSLQNVAPVGSIILVLTPILISRFLLNLRQLGEPENEIQSCFDPQFSVLGFRVPTSTSIVGNMGADLDHSPAEETDYVAEDADVGSRHDASMDGPAENLPGTPVMEDIFEIQEV